MRFAFVCVAACVIGLAISSQARAYNLFGPYPWGTEGKIYYEKWGDIFSVGVPGGTITWSFIPDGTPIDPSFTDANFSGTSSLTNIMNSLGYNDALAAIQRAFDKWSAVSNISFQQVSDSGVAFNSPSAVTPNTGQIRIGAYAINGSVGAVGWSGWPFGDTLSGDILLNSSNLFQIHQGNEGDPVRINGTYYNDLEGLVVHEIGHTMGIAHTNICSVMSGNPACYELLNRELDPDDIAAAQFLYGPSPSADFDQDNDVDGRDFLEWQRGNSNTSQSPEDLALWQAQYGDGLLGAIVAVPEPASATGVLSVFALSARRIRRPSRTGQSSSAPGR